MFDEKYYKQINSLATKHFLTKNNENFLKKDILKIKNHSKSLFTVERELLVNLLK